MEKRLESAFEDSAGYIQRRFELEPSFLGLLLYNFPREKTNTVSRCAAAFSRKNNLNAKIINASAENPANKIYDYISSRKRENKSSLFIILDPLSEIAAYEDIMKNCFSIDAAYFKN